MTVKVNYMFSRENTKEDLAHEFDDMDEAMEAVQEVIEARENAGWHVWLSMREPIKGHKDAEFILDYDSDGFAGRA